MAVSQKLSPAQCLEIYQKACLEGLKAGNDYKPRPMVVQYAAADGLHKEVIDDGLCGFAWVNVKNGNSPFCRWLKSNNHGRKDSYYGGVTVWVHEFGQSHAKKVMYARAFARVLREHGLECYAMDRLD